jgi:monothiol glutaredoxin
MSQPKITAYMKPVCGWSNGVRAIFQKYSLEYEDRDIINNPENYREMVEKSGQPLQPTLEIDDVILPDVSGDEVEAYLIEKGYVTLSDADAGAPTDQACADHGEVEVDVGLSQGGLSNWASNLLSKSR